MPKILPEFVLDNLSVLSVERCSYVYTLIHKETNEVFYVGKGTQDGQGRFQRFSRHERNAKEGSLLHVHRKMRKLWHEGQTITWEIVKRGLTNDEALECEKKLIAAYGLDQLTNVDPSGVDHSWLTGVGVETPTRTKSRNRRSGKREIYLKNKTTGEVHHFDSICAAVRTLRIPSGTLYHALFNKETSRTQPSYFVSTEPFSETVPPIEKEKPNFYQPIWVKNKKEDSIRRFSSLSEASRELGIAINSIKHRLHSKGHRSLSYGHLLFSKTPLP